GTSNTVPLSIFSHSVSRGRNTNSASKSTKFRINHGQATRSTLIFSRVIHFMPERSLGTDGQANTPKKRDTGLCLYSEVFALFWRRFAGRVCGCGRASPGLFWFWS